MELGSNLFLKAEVFTWAGSGLPEDDITDLAYDSANDLFWMSTSTRGVASLDYNARSWRILDESHGLVSSVTHSIAVDQIGTIWVGTQTGLTKWQPDGKRYNFTSGSGLPGVRVRRVRTYPVGTNQDQVWLSFIERGAGEVLEAPKQ
jgi:ligand-binding sensor domain-containing protein